MDSREIRAILEKTADGRLSADEAYERLKLFSFEELGFAKLDHHRALRTGSPEVIYAPGKTDAQIIKIFESMRKVGSDVIVSRAKKSTYDKIRSKYKGIEYHQAARMITLIKSGRKEPAGGTVAVVTGGTSDINVAEEAAVTVEAFGGRVQRIYDVGVAGIHRLLAYRDKLTEASVVIVAAGMEGALASVVGGLVAAPVIAAPTSVGYGASFGGLAALLAMLNSCAPGVTVVNIDNGFGAAMAALKIMAMNKKTQGEK